MQPAGKVSINDCVGQALRFARTQWRFVALLAAICAGTNVAFSALSLALPAAGTLFFLIVLFVQALIYAGATGAALGTRTRIDASLLVEGLRVFSAMSIVGFFLMLVMFVAFIPGAIILAAGPLAPYVGEMQQATGDQARTLALMTRFAQENPLIVLAVFLIYAALWMTLTSRLFLAAPATVAGARVLTFETWRWTAGQTLAIVGARLLLLTPAYVLVYALPAFVGRLVGLDTADPFALENAARANAALVLGYVFVERFVYFAVYTSLEAGLSAAFYRALKPAEAVSAQA